MPWAAHCPVAIEGMLKTIAEVSGYAPDSDNRFVVPWCIHEQRVQDAVLSGINKDANGGPPANVDAEVLRPHVTLHVEGFQLPPVWREPRGRMQVMEHEPLVLREVRDGALRNDLGAGQLGVDCWGVQSPETEVMCPRQWRTGCSGLGRSRLPGDRGSRGRTACCCSPR